MIVAILSDTHGKLHPQLLARINACDMAVHAGDIGNWQIIEVLHSRCDSVQAVLGNNDVAAKWPAEQRDRLAAIPWSLSVNLPGGVLAVEHGHRAGSVATRHQKLRERYPQARAVVYGHSHRLIADLEREPWVLNPGAAGMARTFGGASCMMLKIDGDDWQLETVRAAS